jgi:DNA-binding NarL/FixJ family response regulator
MRFMGSNLPMPLIRVLVADDYPPWRGLVCSMLQKAPGFQVIGEVSDGLEAVQKATELRPDIVLLDIGMPVLNGIDAAKKIGEASPRSRIIFLTQNDDCEVRSAALATRAEGYVLKARAASDLQPAITTALRKGVQSYVPNSRPVAKRSS